jgi:hypothetical protein
MPGAHHDPRERETCGEKFGDTTVAGVSERRCVVRGAVGAVLCCMTGACSTVVWRVYVGSGVKVRTGAGSTVVSVLVSGVGTSVVGGGGGGGTAGIVTGAVGGATGVGPTSWPADVWSTRSVAGGLTVSP